MTAFLRPAGITVPCVCGNKETRRFALEVPGDYYSSGEKKRRVHAFLGLRDYALLPVCVWGHYALLPVGECVCVCGVTTLCYLCVCGVTTLCYLCECGVTTLCYLCGWGHYALLPV